MTATLHQFPTMLDYKYLVSFSKCMHTYDCYDSTVAPSSEPTSLNVTVIGSDYVNIHWTNPSSSDATLTRLIVELTGPSSVTIRDVTAGNTNLSATNTFRVDRLQLNTSYSVRVRGVSTHPAVGDILGTWSSNVSFMTMVGGEWNNI